MPTKQQTHGRLNGWHVGHGAYNSDRMGALLNPTHGIRDEQARKGMTPRDHHKDNMRALRQMQDRNRRKHQDEEQRQLSAKLRGRNYSDVSPRVFSAPSTPRLQTPRSAPATPKYKPFSFGRPQNMSTPLDTTPSPLYDAQASLHAAASAPALPTSDGITYTNDGLTPRASRPKTKPPIPHIDGYEPEPFTCPAPKKNFIRRNMEDVKSQSRPCTASEREAEPPSREKFMAENFGKVPRYILDRKLMLAEEAARAARAEEAPPPGMRTVTEEERQKTLQILKESRTKVTQELATMPFIVDTLGLKKKQAQLEARLQEIDEALKIFVRKQVVVVDEEAVADMHTGMNRLASPEV